MKSEAKVVSLVASIVAASFLLAAPPAVADLTDTGVHTPPNYYGFQPPGEGQSYVDPVFGSTIKRVSDARIMPDATGGASFLTWVVTEYSTMSPWNLDNSYLLLATGSYFGLFDGQGSFLRNLPFEVGASSEPRWSRSRRTVFYYLYGNQLKSYDVSTSSAQVVHTFTEYSRISAHGESDIGFNGDKLALAGDDRKIFEYDIATLTKGPVLDISGAPNSFDGLYLTPDDNLVVTWPTAGTGRYHGIEFYSKSMAFQRQLAVAPSHQDVTRDNDGSEILVFANGAQPQQICTAGIVKIKLSTGAQTCIFANIDWSLASHISCPDRAGGCIVETYAPSDPNPSTFWPPYTDEILWVPLDGSAPHRLAHHRSRPFNSYTYQPRTTISHDATRLVYSSNYGLQQILGYPTEYSDVYMIDVSAVTGGSGGSGGGGGTGGSGGGTGGGGTGTSWTRVEQNDPSVGWAGIWYPNSMSIESGGSAAMSMDLGGRSRFTFNGTGVRWIGYRDAWSGKARIWLDGTAVATVDTYSASDQAQAVVFDKEGLAAGTHTIEIEALQQKSASSGGMWVWIDAFDVTSGSGTTGTGGTGGTGGGGTGVLIWSDGFENGGVTRWSGDRVQ